MHWSIRVWLFYLACTKLMCSSLVSWGSLHGCLTFFLFLSPKVRTLFLQWLPWVLRMQRPGKPITRKTIMMTNRMKELEMKEKGSKSLLANVLDMDDDFRWDLIYIMTFLNVLSSFSTDFTQLDKTCVKQTYANTS